MENKQNKGGGLNKSLKLIFVYTVATGSIFTFVNYWDSVFYGYCGSGTFLAFALMTVAILPVALVYSELASLFHTSGGELIYNTVGINKHVGFLASWLIMAAWISVPPAVVMAIMTWVNKTFALGLGTWQMVGCAAVLLVLYFFMSIQNVQFLVKAQAGMLFCNITVTIFNRIYPSVLRSLAYFKFWKYFPVYSGLRIWYSWMGHWHGTSDHTILRI